MNYARSDVAAHDFWNHEHLRAVMDQLGIARAALVGVSMGGGTAIDFTLRYPERVTALVVVAPGLGGYPYSDDTALTEARAAIGRADEAGDRDLVVELTVRLWVDGPDRSPEQVNPDVRRRMTEMLNLSWEKGDPGSEEKDLDPSAMSRLVEIKTPTLVIYGSGDVRALVGASQYVAEHVAGAEVTVMEGLAHVPNMESPREFNRLVLDFLAKHTRRLRRLGRR